MRTSNQTGPKLRVRREGLRLLTTADLRAVAGGSQKCNSGQA